MKEGLSPLLLNVNSLRGPPKQKWILIEPEESIVWLIKKKGLGWKILPGVELNFQGSHELPYQRLQGFDLAAKQCAGHCHDIHFWACWNTEILSNHSCDWPCQSKPGVQIRRFQFLKWRCQTNDRHLFHRCWGKIHRGRSSHHFLQQRFCLRGRARQQRFWRDRDRPNCRDLLCNCWPWFFDDLIAESKTKKTLQKKGKPTFGSLR